MGKPKTKFIKKEEWLKAVRDNAGIIGGIAATLKLDRTTVFRKAQAEPWLKEAIFEATESTLDLAELSMRAAIECGNMKAIMWFLERKGRDRGYGKELKIETDSASKPNVVIYIPDNGRKRQDAEQCQSTSPSP
jgi:hypothetical protein